MLVCHCNGVSDRAIRKAVRKGASTLGEIGMMTGAGTCCGGCVDAVKSIVRGEAGSSRDRSDAPDMIALRVVPT